MRVRKRGITGGARGSERAKNRLAMGLVRSVPGTVILFAGVLVLLAGGGCSVESRAQNARSAHAEPEAFRDGMKLLKEGNGAAALEQFRKLERQKPDAPEGWAGEGIALALSHEPEKAIGALRKALSVAPDYLMARRELGILEWESNDKDEAATELKRVIKAVPTDGTVAAIVGEYSFEKGKYADAVEYLGNARTQVDRIPRLSLMLACALIQTKRMEPAIEVLDRVGEGRGLTPEERFRTAWLLGEAGAYGKAIAAFQALPADFADPMGRDYGLALAYYQGGRYEDCIQLLSRDRGKGNVRAEMLNLLGAAKVSAGHAQEAYDAFREGIERFPNEEDGYLNAATVAIQSRDYATAERVLDLGIQHIPSSYRLVLTRGAIYTLGGDLGKAEVDYKRAVLLGPEESATYAALGICYMDEHKNDEAKRVFRGAIHMGMQDVRLYYYLVDVLFEDGMKDARDFQEGTYLVNASIRFEPDFAYSYLQRGRLKLMTSHVEEAIADFEHARKLEPDSTDTAITYQLAIAYRDAGRRAEANRLLAEVHEAIRKQDARYRQGAVASLVRSPEASGFTER